MGTLKTWIWIPVFLILVSLGAQAMIHLDSETLFTLQTLFIGICFYYMPRNFRLIAVLLYLGIGIAGLPVFSNARSGWEYFSQDRVLGYFIGFIAAAFLNHESDFRLPNIFTYFILLHLVVVGLGILFIAYSERSFEKVPAIIYALLPGLAIKSVAGSLIVWSVARYRSGLNSRDSG